MSLTPAKAVSSDTTRNNDQRQEGVGNLLPYFQTTGKIERNMFTHHQETLEQRGWKEVTAAEFLGLTPEEEAIVETSLILSRLVRQTREERGWSQRELADHLGKKQTQVARLESGNGVSFEAQFAALFAMGVQPRTIAEALMEVSLNIEPMAKTEVEPLSSG
ncbi:MAG: XRE family transcriptional regulator [Proteobacteria bacterium]|nr:MAG: XRE family transcriptional regulator [Pseudomonadota bacterium]